MYKPYAVYLPAYYHVVIDNPCQDLIQSPIMHILFCCQLVSDYHQACLDSAKSKSNFRIQLRANKWNKQTDHDQCGVSTIQRNRFNQYMWHVWWQWFIFGDLLVVRATQVRLHCRHSIGGQCSSLVRANCCCIAHCLTSIQMPYQVVVQHHFLQNRQISF